MTSAPIVVTLVLSALTVLGIGTSSFAQSPAETLSAPRGLVTEPPSEGLVIPTPKGHMVAYNQTLPGSEATIEMVPVPGGVVRISVAPFDAEDATATPEEESYIEVELAPYWISRHEITWEAYWQFMQLDATFTGIEQLRTLSRGPRRSQVEQTLAQHANLRAAILREPELCQIDAVTAPTALYDSSTTYESGREPNLPAVSMTPFAAKQFTKWLSRLTGVSYRLPSEAEWQHAAQADAAAEPKDLDAVAWTIDNSDYVAHPVGQKLPNAWGLHDMLGNVAELVLDAATPAGRPALSGKRVDWQTAIAWPEQDYPMQAKGGHYDSELEEISVTARLVTNPDWKDADPNLPRSPWWFASYPSNGVGFRLVRPMMPIDAELASRVWDADTDDVVRAVEDRLREGRGKVGWIAPRLPAAARELETPEVSALLK
ncbi:formylglycine-generating enzyme family protein [Botrimarina hoheduenensis]|uniref:Formylglycine-generating sulfatase enzyme n=1 Tax=Botrimarina hoheduenensis TaxID=2528000 RepID=A0A5C5VWU0_9BACT|nr:SUMF1/EgtB/PvdO family nonheme iron enzyme [Botrimarina hoheduenensis]TWT42577.1 Formylglycine-generating sulfatase enzyme [Botrimarina hoheduenensis]